MTKMGQNANKPHGSKPQMAPVIILYLNMYVNVAGAALCL